MIIINMIKPILRTTVGLQSVALLGTAASSVPPYMYSMKPKKSKFNDFDFRKQNRRMIRSFTGIMVGVPLLGATAGMINKL